MKHDIKGELFQSVINFARANQADLIDKAYEFFWEEDDPQDFLGGTALSLAFINFEDWLVCDYRTEDGNSLIDIYLEASEELDADARETLETMKGSSLGLYEVVSSDGEVKLKNLLIEEEFTANDESLKNLAAGDLFASRFVILGGEHVMSRCVYPFSRDVKDRALGFVDKNFKRYTKHKNTEGTIQEFLKEESYLFNILWIDNIFRAHRAN
jgi:hypothetical protein